MSSLPQRIILVFIFCHFYYFNNQSQDMFDHPKQQPKIISPLQFSVVYSSACLLQFTTTPLFPFCFCFLPVRITVWSIITSFVFLKRKRSKLLPNFRNVTLFFSLHISQIQCVKPSLILFLLVFGLKPSKQQRVCHNPHHRGAIVIFYYF